MKKYATRKNAGKPQKSGKGDGNGNSKSKLIIIASVVSTLAYFLLNQSPVEPIKTTAPAKVEPPPVAAAAKAVEIVETPKAPPPVVDIQKLRSAGLGNLQFKFQNITLKVENGRIKIPFHFSSHMVWCTGGDLDLFKLLTRNKDDDEFLITIETLTSKVRGDRARVSYNQLLAGFDKTFQIDLLKPTESLGLFICRDKEKTKTCRGKELQTYPIIYDRLADKKTESDALSKDYILYYQNFIVKEGMLFTYSHMNISAENQKKFQGHMVSNYDLSAADVDASTRFSNVTRSLPATIEKGKIVLSLPYNDPRCFPGGNLP